MEIISQKQSCCGCEACSNICPVQAIEMKEDGEGFLYPMVDEAICIHCNKCKNICPINKNEKSDSLMKAYGCYANNEVEQMESSSGGVFSVLSRFVLRSGGIVCGVAYDNNQLVYHKTVKKENELYQLKETKYVQSKKGNIYKDIKQALQEDKVVLFSGTPCEVAGIKGYLQKDYEKLLCVDLICHGVPSPKIWNAYKDKLVGSKKIESVTFRNKSQGMNNITIDYRLGDGTVIKEKLSESLYMKGFIQNLYVRPSCFRCKFKGNIHESDITIGDFWAAKEYHSEIINDKGISAVIAHTKKGEKWLETAREELKIWDTTVEKIACWNENLLISAKENPNREKFFKEWNEENLFELIQDYTQKEVKKEKENIIRKLKHIVGKVYNCLKGRKR